MNLSIFPPLFGVVIFISTLKCQWHLVRGSRDPFLFRLRLPRVKG